MTPDADALAPLLSTLARRRAVVPLVLLPGRLEMPADEVATLLGLAVEGGRVELWRDCPGGPAALLSTLEANRRGLVLDGGRSLAVTWVCLICHRSGADHLFKPIPAHMRPKPYKYAPGSGLAGGVGAKKKTKGKGKRATREATTR